MDKKIKKVWDSEISDFLQNGYRKLYESAFGSYRVMKLHHKSNSNILFIQMNCFSNQLTIKKNGKIAKQINF